MQLTEILTRVIELEIMFKYTIEVLQSGEFLGGGEHIEFAKGSKEKPRTFKKAIYKMKRLWHSKKR